MKKRLILLSIGLVLLLAGCVAADRPASPTTKQGAQPVAETPASEPTSAVDVSESPSQTKETGATPEAAKEVTGEPDDGSMTEAEQVAQMALINPPPQLSQREPGITITPCEVGAPSGPDEVEGETYICGIFTAPMNWDDPSAGYLDMNFAVAKATGDNPSSDPLVVLAGGPGQSAVTLGIDAYPQVRQEHDIVRLAQRGTGFGQRLGLEECLVLALQGNSSTESLETLIQAVNPPEDDSADSATPAPDVEEANAQLDQLCWDLFEQQGLDLNQFTTTASARDVIELVKALGYDSFNLHGVSYGTRLAMIIMAQLSEWSDAPQLRSVVLDSPFPPSNYLLSSMPRNYHDQVLQLFDDCQQDESCRQAYPNLKHRLRRLLDSLKETPLETDGETISDRDVVNVLADLTGTRSGFMPKMIAELEQGIPDTYLALKNDEVGTEDPEGIPGFDLSDPVQAFIVNAIAIIGQTGDQGAIFEFIAAVADAFSQEDPITAMTGYINQRFEGESQAQLLDLLTQITPEDLNSSSYVKQLRTATASIEETPQDAEQQAADQLAQQRLLAVINVAHFLNKNIHCNEDIQFERYEDGLNTYHDLDFPEFADLDNLHKQANNCTHWPVDAAPIEIKNPVSSSVPTLILQGTYDTKTPVFLGIRTSRELQNSTLALIPQQGHEVWTNATYCVGQIASAFVLNPNQKPDLSCLDKRRPQWALPEDGETKQ